MKLSIKEIAKATGAELLRGKDSFEINGISTDTRAISSGNLFVAIKGPHFDGHDFVGQAVEKGAKAVLVSHPVAGNQGGVAVLRVSDTVRALGDIASMWRSRFKLVCIAVTGSNGKSTTKEMLAAAISGGRRVIKTEGNFNNLIGLPLQVLRLSADTDVAVFEMGMNAPGEIRRLTEIADPDIGLITNVNPAHLEKLHTMENVAKAKGELFEKMSARGTIIVNAEDPWIVKLAAGFKGKKITFGMQDGCDVLFGRLVSEKLDSARLTFYADGKEYFVNLPVPGVHNAMNSLAAVAAGVAAGASVESMIPGLEKFEQMKMRMERIQLLNGVQLVSDCYNANPASMEAAFRTVSAAKKAGRFIAVLGDMLELGEAAREKHAELGKLAADFRVAKLFVTGEFADDVARGALKNGVRDVLAVKDLDELKKKVLKELKTGDVVMIKGSRGMKMERIAEFLKNEVGV